ncbi:DUF2501 domain-containing protein [Acerihabitans arboris]|uniref:DUF2501 domain-containing protein n=1 Tax=Acerihabitans arboris TaxID=2691583 RepID=A0A845SQ87_9GAMM|nr:DUF2501 domain-containing protein [Acerihabitans arboris]NDL65076.1 DUF2501 domain-containing protein [Acerihabitans arboris]
MITTRRVFMALAVSAGLSIGLASGAAQAAGNWMDSVNSAVSEMNKSSTGNGSSTAGAATGNNASSLAALSGLLNGGDKSLSSSSMTNAAGVLQYCVKNNLLSANGTSTIKDRLLGKLGISSTPNANSQDYQEGLGGLLTTGKNGQLNLNDLSNSQLGQKVKTKACDVVLKQSKNFIS